MLYDVVGQGDQTLLAAGTDVHAPDSNGWTPLHLVLSCWDPSSEDPDSLLIAPGPMCPAPMGTSEPWVWKARSHETHSGAVA